METYDWVAFHEQQLLEAVRDQDVAALDKLIHPDALFTIATGQTITKQEDLAAYRAGHLQVQHLHAQAQQVRLIANAAVVAVTIELRGFYQGHPIDGHYRYLRVWQQQEPGRWQVIGGSSVALPS